MHEDEVEEDVVDVWFCVLRAGDRGDPVGTGDAVVDEFAHLFDRGLDVGLEEASVDLAEGVSDCFALVCEFDGEVGFEL